MFAQLCIYLPHSEATWLGIYKTKKAAQDDPHNPILRFELTNEQLTEFVVVQRIRVVDLNQ